ncbi:MAG TPA: type VI secretion system baseplate subunit TssK [Cellvibrio sp.]|nr:type VI secretion system baseplate subunit TssK [Cellvibrio sp.]
MHIHQLAPVNWQMGQTLLPDHLVAQEDALAGEARLRFLAQGLPAFGIARLEWDEYLLAQGTLDIKNLRIFARLQNLMVDYPGNSLVVSQPLHFENTARANIYYFIFQENIAANNFSSGKFSTNNVSIGSNNDGNRTASVQDSDSPPKRLFKLVLAQQPTLPEQFEHQLTNHSLVDHGKLAEYEQAANKRWSLSERYIPPLMQVGTSAFLQRPLQQLSALLSRYLTETYKICALQQLPELRHFEMKQCASVVSQTLQYLANHIGNEKTDGEIYLHPYFLYEQLQNLNRELALLSGEWAALNIQSYRHHDLHGLFKVLFRNIIAHLKHHSRSSQSFELLLKDGCYRTQLPATLNNNDKLFLIIHCDGQPAIPANTMPRISSHKRINMLHNYSLSGVALKAVRLNAITHYFGEMSQCFQLLPGTELSYIIRDRSLAFLAQPEFSKHRFYLFYQPALTTTKQVSHVVTQ